MVLPVRLTGPGASPINHGKAARAKDAAGGGADCSGAAKPPVRGRASARTTEESARAPLWGPVSRDRTQTHPVMRRERDSIWRCSIRSAASEEGFPDPTWFVPVRHMWCSRSASLGWARSPVNRAKAARAKDAEGGRCRSFERGESRPSWDERQRRTIGVCGRAFRDRCPVIGLQSTRTRGGCEHAASAARDRFWARWADRTRRSERGAILR